MLSQVKLFRATVLVTVVFLVILSLAESALGVTVFECGPLYTTPRDICLIRQKSWYVDARNFFLGGGSEGLT